MTRSEKNLCTKFASKSYAFIPECTTESACFVEVTKIFKTKLNYSDESKLYEIKNHVARSWYFYNQSLKDQKNIQNYCQKGDNIALSGAINQTQDLISDSFHELDLAMKKSFELIAEKEANLTKSKIDLVKEEKIYSDLIELRQIISELNTGGTNSDTYVSYYTKKSNEFAKSSASKGFNVLVEKTPFWIEEFELIDETALKKIGLTEESYFPFVKNIFSKAIDQAELLFFKKQSLLALSNFPLYEFMKLYSNLGGNNNSALKRFADLMNRISENENELNKKIEESWKVNENKALKINELLLEKNKFAEFKPLADKLIEKTITIDNNLLPKVREKLTQYLNLKEEKSSSKITKGEELNRLRDAEINFEEYILRLEFEANGFSEKLIKACKSKAEEKIDDKNITNLNIIKLIQEVNYFASRTKNTQNKECLLSCTEMVAKIEELNQALTDYAVIEENKKNSSKECLSFLEKIFLSETLSELKSKYELLKETKLDKEKLAEFEKECNSIKKQVQNELNSTEIYKKILSEYTKLKNNILILNKISFYLNASSARELFDSYEKKALVFEDYFENETIKLDKISPLKEEILQKIVSINRELEKVNEAKGLEYIQKNVVIKTLNSESIETNNYFDSKKELIIDNPFFRINHQTYLQLTIDLNNITKKDEWITSVENNLVNLEYIPVGKTLIYFEETSLISTIETDSFEYSSNELSLLKRELTFNPKTSAQNVIVGTTNPKNTVSEIVLVNNENILYAVNENKTKFLVEKLTPQSSAEILFYISNIIELTKELIETKTTDIDETLIYKVSAKNTLSKKLLPNLIIPLPSTSAEITVYSQDYTKKEIKKIGDKIIIQNQSFLENETKYYEIWVKTSDALDYYQEGLKKQESFFTEHNQPQKAEETQKIIKTNELILMKKIFESNSLEIQKIETDEKNKSNLELMKQKLLEKIEELRQKQKEFYDLGLITNAEKIGSAVDLILNEKLENEKDIAKAFDRLLNLSSSSDNKLKTEAEKMWETMNKKDYENTKINELKNSFFEKKTSFEEAFSFDPLNTQKNFSELQKIYILFEDLSKELDKNYELSQKEFEKRFNFDLNYCLTSLAVIEKTTLEKNAELIKAKFISPLTQSRIEKIRLLLGELKNSEKSFEEKLKEIEPITSEIWSASESIKKQAILEFNKAVDRKESKESLAIGRKLIDENKFIDAFLLFAPNNSNPLPNLTGFTFFLPILIIIIAALAIKNNLNKKEKEDNEKKEIIKMEWEKI
jgi:hypothetical protein